MTTATALPLVSRNGKGIALLVLGIMVFSVQDMILKLLSGAYPLHQAMVIRSLTALPLMLAIVHFDTGLRSLLTPLPARMAFRGLTMFTSYLFYYLALASLPLASTVALFFAAPLFITVLSVFILHEQVGPRRWLAVSAGFVGVIVMIRPGTEIFDWAALLAVGAGLAYGFGMVLTRRMGETESGTAMAFWGNILFLLISLALSAIFGSGQFASAEVHPSLGFLTRAWVLPPAFDLALMMACGAIAAIGLSLLTQAYRIANSSTVAPFEYTAMIWGVFYGWMFFHDWPTPVGWLGITIIIGSGLYVLYRERLTR